MQSEVNNSLDGNDSICFYVPQALEGDLKNKKRCMPVIDRPTVTTYSYTQHDHLLPEYDFLNCDQNFPCQ